jgi:hypothetical protein
MTREKLVELDARDAVELRGEDAGDGRELVIRIVPWDTVAQTESGPEKVKRGAFAGVDPARVTVEALRHDGALVGRGTALEDRDDGAYLTARIAATAAGDELLELVREGVVRDASVVFAPRGSRSRKVQGVTVRESMDLRRVAILERGAYPGAEVVAMRSEGEDMTDQTPVPVEPAPVDVAAIVRGEVQELRRELAESAVIGRPAGEYAELFAYRSLGEALRAAVDSAELSELLSRAWADQITTDNPGVVPPAWLSEVKGIVAPQRRAINAFGVERTASGMSVDFPYFDGNLANLVAKQFTQKTAIASAKLSILKGDVALGTYAGGSDISLQLIRRSSPDYLTAYGRIMLAAWAAVTEAGAAAAIGNAGRSTPAEDRIVAPWGSMTKPEEAQAAAFELSLRVEAATGAPASFLLASTEAYLALGKLLTPAPYGTVNTAGVATARTLVVELSGLPVYHAPGIGADAVVIASNQLAGKWYEDGPMWVSSLDPEKLGENRAVWSLGAFVPYITGGIQITEETAPAP